MSTNTTNNQFTSTQTTVQAVQWLNDDQSLRAVQSLIFPLSPWRMADLSGQAAVSSRLGVPRSVSSDVQFIAPTNWVVKYPDGRIETMTDVEFGRLFSPATGAGRVRATTPAENIGLTDIGEGLRDA